MIDILIKITVRILHKDVFVRSDQGDYYTSPKF